MVRRNYFIKLNSLLLSFFGLSILTGCPGPGDRMRFDETAQVSKKGDNVCVNIDNAQDYQPVDMGINLLGTSSKEKNFNFSPGLKVSEGELCIPPSYFHFENGSKYIVEFVLHPILYNKEARSFVVGVGINNNQVYNFPLTDREFARPYGSIQISE
ncbi:putative T6SS immunity periplasmic lipoprotein [Kluyvera sichuanensis]|uniref:putative T6SS immunity periplasmic lipoprotein n=1 Tax=Kluyvera sichuanensis TaxID=2725494 RepID=UPI002FD45467